MFQLLLNTHKIWSVLIWALLCCDLFAKTIVVNPNEDISKQLNTPGARYVFNGDVDLNGCVVVAPRKAIFEFRECKLHNGQIQGEGNTVLFQTPFLADNIFISGCHVDNKKIRSQDIYIENSFSNQVIHNLFNLALPGAQVSFEQGIYSGITPLYINKSITLDFSNSILETEIDDYELSSSVFITPIQPAIDIKSVSIKNVTIDGKLPRYGLESGIGPRRNAIRLIGVRKVELDNVTIRNFRFGTSGYYEKDLKKCHMAGVCAILGYSKCLIHNCSLSMCTGEGFYLVPKERGSNHAVFKENKSINNYGTFLTLVDGRCLVENNEMNIFGLSGMNVFCYNSVIRNNIFKGGERFNCIDITENGLYWPKNVEISNNTAEGCEGFIMVSGENIYILNNECKDPSSGFALTIWGYINTNEESPEFMTQRKKNGTAAIILIENNNLQCKGGIATYQGCKGELNVIRNTITVVPDVDKKYHRGTAMEFYDCKKIHVEGNTLNDSFNNSITQANVFITINSSTGEAVIKGNSFNRNVISTDNTYFLFTEDTAFDHLIVEDNVTNVKGISARGVEGRISVKGKKTVRNNEGFFVGAIE